MITINTLRFWHSYLHSGGSQSSGLAPKEDLFFDIVHRIARADRQQSKMKLLLILLLVGCALALPKNYYKRYARKISYSVNFIRILIVYFSESARLQSGFVRPRRAPLHRTMLISGYYRPLYAQRRQGYEPETAMTAFATGESVAAGSYLGARLPNCISCDTVEQQQDTPEFVPQLDQPQAEPEAEVEKPVSDLSDGELSEALVPVVPASDEVAEPIAPPKRKTNKKLKQPVIADDDESDDVGEQQDTHPLRRGQNTYFPIMFSGYPGRSASGGSGGGVTAIANAYSTGKGGVATSHATAYGGAPPRSKAKNNRPDNDDEE
jgi:hypothetical protein